MTSPVYQNYGQFVCASSIRRCPSKFMNVTVWELVLLTIRFLEWESTTGLRQAKGLISGPCARRTKDLLKLNRDQLRWIVELFTGHCHLKGHLFKVRLTGDPTCERFLEEDESATHILCDCEAIAHLRFRHLCRFFMEPSDFYNAPISKFLHFIRRVGVIKG
jgi:hypothetical protein